MPFPRKYFKLTTTLDFFQSLWYSNQYIQIRGDTAGKLKENTLKHQVLAEFVIECLSILIEQ